MINTKINNPWALCAEVLSTRFVQLFMYLLFISVCAEWFRYSLTAAWLFFTVLPIYTFVNLIKNKNKDAFYWLRTYSVVMGCLYVLCVRQNIFDLQAFSHWQIIVVGMFGFNILGSVVTDCVEKRYLSVFTGFLVLIMMPTSFVSVSERAIPDVVWHLPLYWIMCYLTWVLSFTINRTPYVSAISVMNSTAPLLLSMHNLALWAEFRAFTLGVFQLMYFNFVGMLKPLYLNTDIIQSIPMRYIQKSLRIVSFMLVVSYVFFRGYKLL